MSKKFEIEDLHKLEKLRDERSLEVYKRNDMIQKARFTLSVQEQKAILYAVSKIKPGDTHFEEYEFDIKKFYAICGIENRSYNRFRDVMQKLSDKSWFLTLPSGEETLVRWFDVFRPNKKSGKVKIAFHRDMMPFLLDLAESGEYYTSYKLQHVLPMKSQYSPRLYELLKSYENNKEWFFEIDTLKRLLGCENYKNFNDFKRFALEPAVREINRYADLCIFYQEQKVGKKVVRIYFFLDEKTPDEMYETRKLIEEELDQVYMDDIYDEVETSPEEKFREERRKVRQAEAAKLEKFRKKHGIKDENDDF